MPVSFVPFGPWAPDAPDLDGKSLDQASGVLPIYGGYRLWPALSGIASGAAEFVSGAHAHLSTPTNSLVYLRPNADTSVGAWVNTTDSSDDLFTEVDESSADDSDSVAAYGAPTAATCKLALSSATDPAVATGHIIRFRYRIVGSTGAWTLDCNLLEGVTERADINASGSADVDWTTATTTLSAGEANAITDYSDLYFTLVATVAGTVQYARPNKDKFGGVWQTSAGVDLALGTNGYTEIDETSADTSDYVQSQPRVYNPFGGPGGSAALLDNFTFNLSNVEDPHTSSGHVLRYRYKGTDGGETFRIRLKQKSTTLATWEHTSIGTAWVTSTQTLSSGVADSITDYSNLRVQVEKETVTIGVINSVKVAWIELEVPSPARAEVSWCEMEVPSAVSLEQPDKVTIYAGCDTALYTVDSSFTDISKAGGYSTGSTTPYSWSFCSYGDHVIATDRDTAVQWDEDAGGAFLDLITSTQKPKARFCAVVRDQLVLANINYSPDGATDMVWWSALDDPQDFDFTTGDSTLCGRRRLRSTPGGITGLVGGESGFVAFKRGSIVRGDFIGSPYVFNTYTIAEGVGTPWPKSIVRAGQDIYFFGSDCLPYVLRGGKVLDRVGHEMVGRYLQDSEFESYPIKQASGQDSIREQDLVVTGGLCARSGLIFWSYRVADESAGLEEVIVDGGDNPYAILCYNPKEGRFTHFYIGEFDVTAWLTIPNTVSSENYLLKGVRTFVSTEGFDSMGSFAAQNSYAATLKTKLLTANGLGGSDQRNILISRVRPVFRAEPNATQDLDWTVSVDYGDNFQARTADLTTVSSDVKRGNGWFDLGNVNCSVFRVTASIPATENATTKDLLGVQVEWEQGGKSNVAGN